MGQLKRDLLNVISQKMQEVTENLNEDSKGFVSSEVQRYFNCV